MVCRAGEGGALCQIDTRAPQGAGFGTKMGLGGGCLGGMVCCGLWGRLEVGKVLFGCLCIISQLPDRPEPTTTSQVAFCV